MSTTKGVKIKYKGSTIHDMPGDGEFKLLTKSSYLEDDLDIQVDRDANLDSKTITANGSYSAASDELDGYDEVTVNVPNSYSESDEGKVVDDGALVAQTSTTKNANGTYDTTLNSEVVVNVPNTYTQSDEGKVVSNGALVAQTSATKTANGTYDTTLNNQIVVDVSGGGGGEIVPDLTYLPNSNSANVKISQDYTTYVSGDNWGKLVFDPPLNATSGASRENNAIRKPRELSIHYDLKTQNKNVTVYLCVKVYETASGNLGLLQFPYSYANGNDPNFHVRTSTLYSSYYGSDTNENIDMTSQFRVLAVAIDGTNKKTRFFCDGTFLREKSQSNSGRLVFVGAGGYARDGANIDLKYIGVVEEFETDQNIISNMQNIALKLGIS